MTFHKSAPVLLTPDLERSITFYEEKLHFRVTSRYPTYAILACDQVEIHLNLHDEHAAETGCYIYVSEIEALYARCTAQGIVHPNGKLADRDWGMREFTVLGVDGNLIRFGQPIRDGAHG